MNRGSRYSKYQDLIRRSSKEDRGGDVKRRGLLEIRKAKRLIYPTINRMSFVRGDAKVG